MASLSLYSLAPELRERIYEEHFRDESHWAVQLEILEVSHLVHEEAKAVFVRECNNRSLALGKVFTRPLWHEQAFTEPKQMISLSQFAKGWAINGDFSLRVTLPPRDSLLRKEKERPGVFIQTLHFLKGHSLMDDRNKTLMGSDVVGMLECKVWEWETGDQYFCANISFTDGEGEIIVEGPLLMLDWSHFGKDASFIKKKRKQQRQKPQRLASKVT